MWGELERRVADEWLRLSKSDGAQAGDVKRELRESLSMRAGCIEDLKWYLAEIAREDG